MVGVGAGRQTMWHDNGQMKEKVIYKDGKVDEASRREWNASGNKLR